MDEQIRSWFVLPGGGWGNPTKNPKKAARANENVRTSEVSVLRENSWEFWVFSRICPNPSQQLDPTNPLILWIGTEGGDESPALPTLTIFLEIYNFLHSFHKIPAVGCKGWWEKTQGLEKKGKEKRTLKSGGGGKGIKKKQKGNCDWKRMKSEMKIIFSSPKSGRKPGGKSGNSGGNLRIGRGSLGWIISHLPQSRMLRGILGSSSSRH